MRRNNFPDNFHRPAAFDILDGVSKIVILAAGRGRRMRREAPGVQLEPEQERMAARGLKGLIPIHGQAYLDYVISAAADAGFDDVCLVVGPGCDPIAGHYANVESHRVQLQFAVQPEPLGTADALLAAEPFAAGEPVLVINSDNYYPAPVLAALRTCDGNAMAGFRAATLTSRGNIPATRITAYALAFANGDGELARIIEKPDSTPPPTASRPGAGRPDNTPPPSGGRLGGGPPSVGGCLAEPIPFPASPGPDAWVSMTCWRFGPRIFDACRSIDRSVRGELELVDAVSYAIDVLGERFAIIPVDEPVIDLSCREDIDSVSRWLRGHEVRL